MGASDDITTSVIAAVLAFAASCMIASAAGHSNRVTWLWGLLGPFGWIVAALRGIQERMDDGQESADASAPSEARVEATV